MMVRERIPLRELTTLRTGGSARFVIEATTVDEVREALAFASEESLPSYVLGEGSNVLAPDEGYEGVIIMPSLTELSFDAQVVVAGAGVAWDTLVRESAERDLWGLENLAGIPGTVGAAPIQNIGAYGCEAKDTISYVEAVRREDGALVRFTNEECAFGYRDSRFKQEATHIIIRVGFALHADGVPNLSYPDLARANDAGVPLTSPEEIGSTVRIIRSGKFPDLATFGTAGSFFKNPVMTKAAFEELRRRYAEIPGYPGENGVKVSLAYLLDKALNLRGHRIGSAWLYDKQPLVLVLDADGSARDVDTLANDVASRVFATTNISIEREVQTLA